MLDENSLHRRNAAERNSNYGAVTSLPKPARSPTFKKAEKKEDKLQSTLHLPVLPVLCSSDNSSHRWYLKKQVHLDQAHKEKYNWEREDVKRENAR